jgi:hypothetical protein
MKFNRAWLFPAAQTGRGRAALAVALIGVCAVTVASLAPASAEQLDPIPQPTGKIWKGSLISGPKEPTYPYVPVLDVRNPDGVTDLDDPKLSWYYMPQVSTWEVDCKYQHPLMGWMYRGTKIVGIPDSGGRVDGYYEMGFTFTKLDNKLKLADVDELCF